MDILVQFEGDVKYATLYIPEVQDNIPDDLRRSLCSKISVKIKSIDRVTKEGLYYKKNNTIRVCVSVCVCVCIFEDHSVQQLCIHGVTTGV